jgi:[acyl-carrier-protein] S-malonyltransferase
MGGRTLLRSARVQRWLARASAVVGTDVAEAIERGLPALRRTEVIQPAITAVCLGLHEALLDHGVRPAFVAGHSLGEVAAFAAARVYDPEVAVELAAERGCVMAAAARGGRGGMSAIHVTTEDEVRAALSLGARAGCIELAAENGPGEWVVAGDEAALAAVAAAFPVVPLPVAGPWHSAAMAAAEDAFRRRLAGVELRAPRCGLVANRDGRLVSREADLADLLAGQLTRRVVWSAVMRTLIALGTRTWVVLGPARGLRALVRRNVGRDARVLTVQRCEDVQGLAA